MIITGPDYADAGKEVGTLNPGDTFLSCNCLYMCSSISRPLAGYVTCVALGDGGLKEFSASLKVTPVNAIVKWHHRPTA